MQVDCLYCVHSGLIEIFLKCASNRCNGLLLSFIFLLASDYSLPVTSHTTIILASGSICFFKLLFLFVAKSI